jgi:hypothetical protein
MRAVARRLSLIRPFFTSYLPSLFSSRHQSLPVIMHDIAGTPQKATKDEVKVQVPGLRVVAPYWHAYATMAKQRWIGREILELVSSEFRDRSIEYYVRVYCVVLCNFVEIACSTPSNSGMPSSLASVRSTASQLRSGR